MLDLSIVIVNWNVSQLLRRCLSSIQTNRGSLSLEVIVVDNASSDDSVSMIRREFPQVRLITNQENLGYTGGNNVGAKEARGRYLFILNPDTEIVEDALQQMLVYMDEHSEVGAVGPQLIYPDGSIQSSRRRFPRLGTMFFQGTSLHWRWFPDNKFVRLHYVSDRSEDELQSVDWLVGAALLIRRETWREVGPFDTQFFMYADEVDWCNRCRRAGWEIHYFPDAKIIHDEHKSAAQISTTTRIRIHQSRILYTRKYFGVGWSNALRLFLLTDYTFLLTEAFVRWVIGRRREQARRHIQHYWQILKSGLH